MIFKLSIVVTVYNTEPYLRRCLDSCVNQENVHPDDFDIIIVNDGSKDNSGLIIEEYVEKYTNVICVTQPNQGLSMARNNGEKAANGDYVWYVDSDDWISPNSVRRIINAMSGEPDVITIRAINDGSGIERNVIPKSVTTGKDLLLRGDWNFCGPFYIYKKDFWEKHEFAYYPGIYHEDAELTPKVLYEAVKVSVIDEVLYFVYQTPGSITRSPNIKRSYDMLFVAERLYSYALQKVSDQNLQNLFAYKASVLLNSSMSKMRSFSPKDQKQFNRVLYEHRSLFECLQKSPMKYKIERVLFSLFPGFYMQVYKIIKFI